MPNYSIVVNSKFNPLSFERYIKPYEIYGQAYKEQEAALEALGVQAETLRQRALSEGEKNATWSQKYLDYVNRLEKQATDLASNGLTSSSRKILSGLKRDYGNSVVAAQEAMKRQEEIAKIRRTTNPALRTLYGDMPTIDQLIADPTANQVSYSGADVEKSAMQLAAAASTRKVSDSFGKFGEYWMRHLKTTGYNSKDISRFMQEASSIPELQNIIGQVGNQFGNFEGLNDRQKQQMAGEIMSGILKGATYKLDSSYQQDPVSVYNNTTGKKKNTDTDEPPQLGFIPRDGIEDANTGALKKNRENLAFLKELMKDRKKIGEKKTVDNYIPTPGGGAYKGKPHTFYTNLTRLQELGKQYNIRDIASVNSKGEVYYRSDRINQLMDKVNSDISRSVIEDNMWVGNFGDNSKAAEVALNVAKSMARNKHTHIYEYVDGKRGDELEAEDLENATGVTLDIEVKNGEPRIIGTYKIGSGDNKKEKAVILESNVFGKTATAQSSLIKQLMGNSKYTAATLAIKELGNSIYGEINNRAKMQTESSNTPKGEAPLTMEEIMALGEYLENK